MQDFSPITSLTKLETLGLAGISITDFSFLEALPNIRWLSLADSDIEDLSLLPDLPMLEELYLHRANNVKDVSSLQRIP